MLTRIQFDILEEMAVNKKFLGQQNSEKPIKYDSKILNHTMDSLLEKDFIFDGHITSKGLNALEPYRAKRAIFIAAGLGSRMIPITVNTPKPLVRVHGVRIIDRLIDACLEAGINEIYIVRGYLAEQFDQLLYKYPMIKFLENPMYNNANNISSSFVARNMLDNAYIFEADLLITDPQIIKKYHYTSNFLAIRKRYTNDWCFEVKNGVIVEEKMGGTDCWQMVGISYWNKEDGCRLAQDINEVYKTLKGKECYWEQVPLVYGRKYYTVAVRECFEKDVIEIDTFEELKAVDKIYNI